MATAAVAPPAPAPAAPLGAGNGAAANGANGSADSAGEAGWDRARAAVMKSVGVSQALRTLRDMGGDTDIDPSRLQKIAQLGEGAFARVESAWYSPPGGGAKYEVAVKILKPDLVANPADLELFRSEVALMAKLSHRNIVGFVGAGELEGGGRGAFVVQEYMGGGTLKSLVTKQMLSGRARLYSDSEALSMCLQIARGLKYLHSCKPMVIHRDLKLENVLLKTRKAEDGLWTVKIADFGLSKCVDLKAASIAARRTASAPVTESASHEMEEHWRQKLSMSSTRSAHLARQASAALRRLDTLDSSRAASASDAASGGGASAALSARGGSAPAPSRSGSRALSRAASAMSRALSIASVPEAPQVFALTGRTGSLMYMSPEVWKGQPYNEKADVFSFAVMMFEILQRYIMLSAVSNRGTYEELEHYCARVAGGFRPPINEAWPEPVAAVIRDCWAQDPAERPSMAEVVARLEDIQASGVFGGLEEVKPCSCVIS